MFLFPMFIIVYPTTYHHPCGVAITYHHPTPVSTGQGHSESDRSGRVLAARPPHKFEVARPPPILNTNNIVIIPIGSMYGIYIY